MLSGGCQSSTLVPPQLLEISPRGTFPPSASWISRPVRKQTAEKVFQAGLRPRAAELAGSHSSRQDFPVLLQAWAVWKTGLSSVKGLAHPEAPQLVSMPTVKKRIVDPRASADSSSALRLFIPAMLRGVYCMFDCCAGTGESVQTKLKCYEVDPVPAWQSASGRQTDREGAHPGAQEHITHEDILQLRGPTARALEQERRRGGARLDRGQRLPPYTS
jgi:hypothetical protein